MAEDICLIKGEKIKIMWQIMNSCAKAITLCAHPFNCEPGG